MAQGMPQAFNHSIECGMGTLMILKKGGIMRAKIIGLAVAVAAGFVVSVQAYAAETRVQEETLVLKDPTVSREGKWIFGGALEGFYVRGPYKQTSPVRDNYQEEGTITGTKPGLNLFTGYGDFTLNYTYRKGDESVDGLFHPATATLPAGVAHNLKYNQQENEISIRWLIRDLASSFLTPYLYAGYVDLKQSNVDTITTANVVWGGTGGSQTFLSQTQWKGAMAGIGGIMPMSDKLGFRADLGAISSRATITSQNCAGCAEVTGSGVGARATGTMYYNFAEGWNVQLGGRYEYLNGGNAGTKYRNGVFAMLGYTFK